MRNVCVYLFLNIILFSDLTNPNSVCDMVQILSETLMKVVSQEKYLTVICRRLKQSFPCNLMVSGILKILKM